MPDQVVSGEIMDVNAGVRTMEARGQFPEKRVDHYTLRIGGMHYLVTAYRAPLDSIPQVGEGLTGELGDADKWDKDRRKFRITEHRGNPANLPAGAGLPAQGSPWASDAPAAQGLANPPGATPAPAASPSSSVPPQPSSNAAPPAPGVDAGHNERLERLTAFAVAVGYIRAKIAAGKLADFTLADLEQLADELQHKSRSPLQPPASVPAPNTDDLPSVGTALGIPASDS